jgi:hypothetical protein
MELEVQTFTMVIVSANDYVTTIEIEYFDWWYEFLRVFTATSMDHFHLDNIKSVTVDGKPIEIPVL